MNRRNLLARYVLTLACAWVLFLFPRPVAAAADPHAGQLGIMGLPAPLPAIASRNPHIDYNIDPTQEKWLTYVPKTYSDAEPCGLMIYITADDQQIKLFPEWFFELLEKRKIIFIAHFGPDSNLSPNRRMGMAAYAALGARRMWKIDPARTYAVGVGAGAHVAGLLGFYASELFAGSVQIRGADFYQQVSGIEPKPAGQDDAAYASALSSATPPDIEAAKKNFRFVFITRASDPHRDQIRDLFDGGYQKDGFHCTFIDNGFLDEEPCPLNRLNQALDFIEKIEPAPVSHPTPPDWMAKNPSQWPQILLRNQIIEKNGAVGYAGSAGLARLPSGIVVLPTAGHLLGSVKPADFHAAFKSWLAFSPENSQSAVGMAGVAMDVSRPLPMDTLILLPRTQKAHWPGVVLPIRTEPLEPGDTVYLIAVPFDSKSRQNVYKGTVIRRLKDGNLIYNVNGSFKTTGCSGAPVMDEWGQFAAVNVGHLNEQNIPGQMQLTCIPSADFLPLVEIPSDVRAPAAEPAAIALKPGAIASKPAATVSNPEPAAAPASAPPGATSIDEEKAESALKAVQPYLSAKMYAKARVKLQLIVKAYPGSDAAKKAQKLLSELPEIQ